MSPSKDKSGPSSAAPRIAIKGFSLSSKSSTNSKSNPSSSALGKRPRTNFQVAQDDSEEEEEEDRDRRGGRQEVVTGFGAEGAIGKREVKEKKVLVIPKQANRDWKSEARARRGGGGKNLLPKEVQAQRRGEVEGKKEGVDVVNSGDGEIEWGLSLRKRVKVEENRSADVTIKTEEAEDIETGVKEFKKEQTADEEAISALLGEKKERTGPDLVISSVSEHHEAPEHVSELDAYKRAVALAPDVSTLEDYERVPVEEFGAALLRGMGWKGEKRGVTKEVKRRQNLLGLGAKELKDAEELGAWVQKSDIKRLNGPGGENKRPERKPKASEYRREEERRRERREERGGGGYRREKERERESERNSGRDYRDSGRESGRDSGRESGWERDRRR